MRTARCNCLISCHARPLPCMPPHHVWPPATHAHYACPHHTCPAMHTPPAMHAPCHACSPAMHAPTTHTPMPCMPIFPKCFQWIQWHKIFVIKRTPTCHLLCKRAGCYHSASKTHVRDRIFKLNPIHASVIYQIHRIHWNHCKSMKVLLHLGKTPISLILMMFFSSKYVSTT